MNKLFTVMCLSDGRLQYFLDNNGQKYMTHEAAHKLASIYNKEAKKTGGSYSFKVYGPIADEGMEG